MVGRLQFNLLLFKLGLKFVWWYNQGVVNVKSFEYVLKQRLQDNYITEWDRAVSNSNDGILYPTYDILKPFYSQFMNSRTKSTYRYSFLSPAHKVGAGDIAITMSGRFEGCDL